MNNITIILSFIPSNRLAFPSREHYYQIMQSCNLALYNLILSKTFLLGASCRKYVVQIAKHNWLFNVSHLGHKKYYLNGYVRLIDTSVYLPMPYIKCDYDNSNVLNLFRLWFIPDHLSYSNSDMFVRQKWKKHKIKWKLL